MKKKIIITVVLAIMAAMLVCAYALPEGHGPVCENCGEKTFIKDSDKITCKVECINPDCENPIDRAIIHKHMVTCSYCGETEDSCMKRTESNGDGTHTINCVGGNNCPVFPLTVTACSGGEATCVTQASCSVCQGYYGEKADHNWSEWMGLEDGYHVRMCLTDGCGVSESGNCYGGSGNCVTPSNCEVCGEEYISNEHNWGEWSEAVDGKHTRICNNDPSHIEIWECGDPYSICRLCNYSVVDPDIHVHDDKEVTAVKPTCTRNGYTEFQCQTCGAASLGRELPRLLHWFDLWSSNENGTHSAACKREGCDHISNNKCEPYEVTIGENTYSVCPVCGDGVFEVVEGALIEGEKLPRGEAIIRGAANPFEGVLYAFTAGYEYSGDMEAFIEAVKVSLPVSVEGEFKLMFAGEEALTEIAYTVEEGILSFETETAGLFIIVPVVEEVEEAA